MSAKIAIPQTICLLIPPLAHGFAGDGSVQINAWELSVLFFMLFSVFMAWFFVPLFLFTVLKLFRSRGEGGLLWTAAVISGVCSGIFFHWFLNQ